LTGLEIHSRSKNKKYSAFFVSKGQRVNIVFGEKLQPNISKEINKGRIYHTWEIRKPVGLGMAHSIPPNLNAKTLVPEKQN
jgi:hypothetical protein